MYETENISVSKRAENIFNLLLLVYPLSYRKQFGNELRIVFLDLYLEELRKNGKAGLGFWLKQITDILVSSVYEHIDLMKRKGMKKYFQQTLGINRYNVVGGILLLPIFTVFLIDLISRIAQGDLVHYNRPVYALLSHTPLYWYPVLFVWVILFPLFAIVINLFPLIQSVMKKKSKMLSLAFLKRNIVSLVLLGLGVGFIAIIRLHDFLPCFVHGLLRVGPGQLPKILEVCRNA